MSGTPIDLAAIEAERARLQARYTTPGRPATPARGIHHAAFICSNVEQTIQFYQGLLEFPLTEIFGNRDYKGSNHFFFDVGNGNLLAFFDFPGLDLGPYMETLGNLNHLAISVTKEKWEYLRGKLDAAGVQYQVASGTSIYFKGPDGVRLELLADPLGERSAPKVVKRPAEEDPQGPPRHDPRAEPPAPPPPRRTGTAPHRAASCHRS